MFEKKKHNEIIIFKLPFGVVVVVVVVVVFVVFVVVFVVLSRG